MTSQRPRQEHVGRTEYQLRMPYPGNATPEGMLANFREIERWGNALPVPRKNTMVPYFIEYTPTDTELEWDVNLVELLRARYDTDLMPAGMWLVGASAIPDYSELTDVVGVRCQITIGTPIASTTKGGSIGNLSAAIRTVKDIDFDVGGTSPSITYEWVLPPLSTSGYDRLIVSDMQLVKITAAEANINVQVTCDAWMIDDPDVGPNLTFEYIPTRLSVFAYRLTDLYGVPLWVEPVEPL